MHNKTARFGVPWKSPTSGLIGPTTYTVICKTQLHNRVPFLSSSKLEPSYLNPSFCSTFYQLPDDAKHKKLGCSPQYTASRTSKIDNLSPGPEAYDVKPVKCMTQADRIAGHEKVKKLYVCRVPYTLVGSGPSVPTKLNANGYSVSHFGDVKPIPATYHDTTLGPAFYDMVQKSRYEKQYRGIDWQCSKTKRDSYKIDTNIPGPADYSLKIPTCPRNQEDEEFREMARLYTFLPRYMDKQEMITKNNNYPGPGTYDIDNGDTCRLCPPLKPTAFLRRSKRFKYEYPDTPSATAYQFSPRKYSTSKLAVPFGIASARFSRKKTAVTPGPAEYSIKSAISEHLEKSLEYSVYKPPFGKSAQRETIEFSKDLLIVPSPQAYSIQDVKSCKLYTSSIFKSKVARFTKQCKTLYGAPARYNDMDAFNATKNFKSHNAFDVSFNATSRKKELFDEVNIKNPCPSSYEVRKGLSQRGCIVPQSPRWKQPADNFPGPGSYLIHPKNQSSMFNAFNTYNSILKEDVLRTSLRKESKFKWAKRAKELKKCKKLRWFENEGKGYVHCHKDLTVYKN
uniref:Sperm-tail PG-rich repeat-containing protein 2-like isoform X1 n=1 Tax=Diabrotica virgifera virgifera TaxID=50390 RepID=A0A6P7HAA8_DIAVI